MDYPISVPSIGLVGGKFVDEDPLAGTPGSLIPAQWGNAVTDEILNVITAAGLVPDEDLNNQLVAAIKRIANGRLLAVRVITTTGTYTPTPGTTFARVKAIGGGGGGGSTVATTSTQFSVSGGGGGGAYCESLLTALQIGASQMVTIGAAGAGGVAGASGSTGGTTTFGALLTAPGGTGGGYGPAFPNTVSAVFTPPGGGASPSTGGNLINSPGSSGHAGLASPSSGAFGGAGGGSAAARGAGGAVVTGSASTTSGANAGVPGAGGGGVASVGANSIKTGGNGGSGMVIVEEYF